MAEVVVFSIVDSSAGTSTSSHARDLDSEAS